MGTPSVALDIETIPNQGVITCIGFAKSIEQSETYSIWYPDYESGLIPDKSRYFAALEIIKRKLTSNAQWVMANGFYDIFWIEQKLGISIIQNYAEDVRWMHHALDPSDDHDLAYLVSKYTKHPFYKSERKGDRLTQLRYNGKDCTLTLEVCGALREELKRQGRLEFYQEHYAALYEPLYSLMSQGIRIDTDGRRARKKALEVRCAEIREQLKAIAGYDLHAKKDFSTKLLPKFLFDDCALPVVRRTDRSKKPATDDVSLRKLVLRHRGKSAAADAALPLIQEHRTLKKQQDFLSEKVEDKDGRVRCEYIFGTDTLRLSSRRNPLGTGLNLQNVQVEARDLFLPEEGCVWLGVDLSTAEDRVVKMLTRDPGAIEKARRPPWDYDAHTENWMLMFGTKPSKEERDLIKRVGHGSNYDMGPERMSETMLKDGIVRTPTECKRYKELYRSRAMPALERYHQDIRAEIMRYRCLTNPWGHILSLEHARMDHETYKRGYAFKPQSTIGIMLNQWGLLPMWEWLRSRPELSARILTQEHDGMGLSVPPVHVWEVAHECQRQLERPMMYYGKELTIPVTFSMGRAWKEQWEAKRLPARDDMVDVAKALIA